MNQIHDQKSDFFSSKYLVLTLVLTRGWKKHITKKEFHQRRWINYYYYKWSHSEHWKMKDKTFLHSVGSSCPYIISLTFRQPDVQSGLRSSDNRKFTGFPPFKAFLQKYRRVTTDGGVKSDDIFWSIKSTKIQSGYVYIHFIYRF